MEYSSIDYKSKAHMADHAASRAPEPPEVTKAREELAPLRAEALAALDYFNALCASLTPAFNAAWQKVEDAGRFSIASGEVHNIVQRFRTLSTNGGNSFRSVVGDIDNLNAHKVYQLVHLKIPGGLALARGNGPAVQRLADELAFHVGELSKRLAAVPAGQKPVKQQIGATIDEPRRGKIDVVTDFETRR